MYRDWVGRRMGAELVAVVLAGGEGRRMGGEKPLRRWRGATLIDHAVRKAQGYAPVVGIAVREAGQVPAAAAKLLIDDPTIPGPLAGVASAIAFAEAQGALAALTLPVDAPLAPDDLAERLLAALGGAAVAMAHSHGRPHPPFALWRADLGPPLAAFAAEGQSSLRRFAERVGVRTADWGDLEPDPFANANTPEDLARLGG